MRQVMVRYKVRPERVEENEELVRAVYDEIPELDEIGSFRLVGDSREH
jgi:hypothetical protein